MENEDKNIGLIQNESEVPIQAMFSSLVMKIKNWTIMLIIKNGNRQ